jgi:LysM repeat protein
LLILLFPLFAHASFITSLLGQSPTNSADTPTLNSQTVPLLAAAVNLDPNPPVGGGGITVADGTALVPQEGPSGTAADVAQWPTSSQVSVYTVHDGDTLSQIAQMFGVSVNTIIWANNIQNGVIHPGDTLIILPITGVEHTVQKGETLASLAKAYNSDSTDIAEYNGISSSAPLTVGESIIIPDGELSATAPSYGSSAPLHTSAPASGGLRAAPGSTEPYLGDSGPPLPGYYAWPLAGGVGVITQGLHGWNAVDIGASPGTDILAAAAGTVIVANGDGGWNGGYGNYVVIQHPNGTQTLYAHMRKVLTSAGTQVAQGDTIGLVGATGEATGPHLHFEVRGAANPFASLPLGSRDPL